MSKDDKIAEILKNEGDCLIFLEGQITALTTIIAFLMRVIDRISGDENYTQKAILDGFKKALVSGEDNIADPIRVAGMEYIFKEIEEKMTGFDLPKTN